MSYRYNKLDEILQIICDVIWQIKNPKKNHTASNKRIERSLKILGYFSEEETNYIKKLIEICKSTF